MKKRETLENLKPAGEVTLRGYVEGGYPGDSVLEYNGQTELAYYQRIIQNIMSWSGLTFDEVEAVIVACSDVTRSDPNQKNRKQQYLEALNNLRSKK